MHPFFVVAVVLPVLFLVCAAAVGYLLGVRYLPAVVAAFVLGWFGFDALYKHTCGPDPRDVRVMKPMAEAISDYIVKHGVPRSLRDIPNLPYRLEGCEREVYYNGKKVNSKIPESDKNITVESVLEYCKFIKNNRNYIIKADKFLNRRAKEGKIYIEIKNTLSETVGAFTIRLDNDKRIPWDNIGFVSIKSTGICNPMRQ